MPPGTAEVITGPAFAGDADGGPAEMNLVDASIAAARGRHATSGVKTASFGVRGLDGRLSGANPRAQPRHGRAGAAPRDLPPLPLRGLH